ncbi:hypothetical protein BH10BAC1_BH10BAC1_09040 [soil metagenome]
MGMRLLDVSQNLINVTLWITIDGELLIEVIQEIKEIKQCENLIFNKTDIGHS